MSITPYYSKDDITLYLGDSLEILPQLNDKIDLVITSPPYFVNKEYEDIRKGDNIIESWQSYLKMLYGIFDGCLNLLNDSGHLWINIDDSHTSLKSELKKNIVLPTHAELISYLSKKIDYKEMILWKKIRGAHSSGGSLRMLGSYGRFGSPGSIPIVQEVEYILWFKKSGNRDASDELRKLSALTNTEFKEFGMQIWNINPERKIDHPAPFPLAIPYRCIKVGSFVGDTVLDPFSGSGTTAIACIKTKRKYIGIERDKGYLDKSIDRIEKEKINLFE